MDWTSGLFREHSSHHGGQKTAVFLFCPACFHFSFSTDLFPPLFSALLCILQPAGWVRYVCAAGCEVVTLPAAAPGKIRETNKQKSFSGRHKPSACVCLCVSQLWVSKKFLQIWFQTMKKVVFDTENMKNAAELWYPWYAAAPRVSDTVFLCLPRVFQWILLCWCKRGSDTRVFYNFNKTSVRSLMTHTHTHTMQTHCWIFTGRGANNSRERKKKQKWSDSLAAVLIGPPLGVTDSSYFFCQADKKSRKSAWCALKEQFNQRKWAIVMESLMKLDSRTTSEADGDFKMLKNNRKRT